MFLSRSRLIVLPPQTLTDNLSSLKTTLWKVCVRVCVCVYIWVCVFGDFLQSISVDRGLEDLYTMTLNDPVWPWMTLYDPVWPCMTLYDPVSEMCWKPVLNISVYFKIWNIKVDIKDWKCRRLFLTVNGNRSVSSSVINDKYKVGKVIGDGNFAVVKECVERWAQQEGRLKINKHPVHLLYLFMAFQVSTDSKNIRTPRGMKLWSSWFVVIKNTWNQRCFTRKSL